MADESKKQSIHEISKNLDLFSDVNFKIEAEIGRSTLLVKDILELKEGSVVEVKKLSGEPIDVSIEGTVFAKAEVIIIKDKIFVRISEILEEIEK
jgi:flagellar motor switch protein FliN/FliY